MNESANDIVFFELDDAKKYGYPDAEPYETWRKYINHGFFADPEWCKENKLMVLTVPINNHITYLVTAKKSWVEENCPDLLDEYIEYTRTPDKYGIARGRYCMEFLEYDEDLVGNYTYGYV